MFLTRTERSFQNTRNSHGSHFLKILFYSWLDYQFFQYSFSIHFKHSLFLPSNSVKFDYTYPVCVACNPHKSCFSCSCLCNFLTEDSEVPTEYCFMRNPPCSEKSRRASLGLPLKPILLMGDNRTPEKCPSCLPEALKPGDIPRATVDCCSNPSQTNNLVRTQQGCPLQSQLPTDDLRAYAYEGDGSSAGSLSSALSGKLRLISVDPQYPGMNWDFLGPACLACFCVILLFFCLPAPSPSSVVFRRKE